MRPSFEKLTENADHSFAIKRVKRKKRSDVTSAGVWHYHAGFEITLTLESSGQRFVGYSIEDYEALDLVLIGENLPHCWITDQKTEQVVINFKKDFLGHGFIERPELKEIYYLLERSKYGIKFGKETLSSAKALVFSIEKSSGFDKLMQLFSLLHLLAHAEDSSKLTTDYDHTLPKSQKASSRIEKVYSYVLNNFRNPNISQAALASDLNMTSSSLCKFVKYMTRKTLFQLILEARVNEACKLLVTSDKYVSEISYHSGFNNLSNFNRAFKKIIGQTPAEYRRSYTH